MVEIIAKGQSLDFEDVNAIKYTLQIADIFNLANVNASYLDGLSLPKTAKNTAILEGLGIVGDTSRAPYTKIPAGLKYYGADIISDGWLIVKDTGEEYKIAVIDGIVDFIKLIEGKKWGVDIPLGEISHEKTSEVVAASQINELFSYIVADYGGKKYTATDNVNIDYLTPSVRTSYLLNKLKEFTGYNFTGPILSDPDVLDLWLSYPKAPKETGTETATEFFSGLTDALYIKRVAGYNNVQVAGQWYETIGTLTPGLYILDSRTTWATSVVTQGTLLESKKYVVPETGTYKLETFLRGGVNARLGSRYFTGGFFPQSGPSYGQSYSDAFTLDILVNGSVIASPKSSPNSSEVAEEVLYRFLNEGDQVEIRHSVIFTRTYADYRFSHYLTRLDISLTDLGAVDFGDALKEYDVKSFFKDFLWRYGITPVTDVKNKSIFLQTFKDKVSANNVIDLSRAYVRRFNESYEVPTFGQKSKFKHKYNAEGDNYSDGEILIDNVHLAEEQDIISSKIYSASPGFSEFVLGAQTLQLPILPTWSSEVKEVGGLATISYKTLGNRFYFIKAKSVAETVTFASEILADSEVATAIRVADVADVHFKDLVPKYYGKHKALLNNFKKHDIELNFSLYDLVFLPLDKIVYFEQEGQYYLINRISWQEAQPAKGEFIRVII